MRAAGLIARSTRLSMAPRQSTRRVDASKGKTGISVSNPNSLKNMDKALRTRSLGRVRGAVSTSRQASPEDGGEDYEEQSEGAESEDGPPAKKRKTGPSKKKNPQVSKAQTAQLHERLFRHSGAGVDAGVCEMPSRSHRTTYHRPLLLGAKESETAKNGQEALLRWFDSVNATRNMPWRKPWIDPQSVPDAQQLRRDLERRAYEVWISEIMLQQTRVAVVIDYWNRWMARWPTIQDLAAADAEDVLAAWRGLGYYSRATRIHEAAKLVVTTPEMDGLLPDDVGVLEAKVPGIGRYTAGAISAIVFGRAEALVDGNVLRVLSRQLGLLANAKSDKATIDLLWAAADALVKDMTGEQTDGKSDRPGRWGQALMELGSTVCTPKPNCADCPITSTCRVYQEGQDLAKKGSKAKTKGNHSIDMEDMCSLCVPLEETPDDDEEASTTASKASEKKQAKAGPKQSTLSAFFGAKPKPSTAKSPQSDTAALSEIVNHARKFPLRVPKKAVREEETLVCAIRHRDGRFLIHRRPDKGLLAGLWEFPSHVLDSTTELTGKKRSQLAKDYVSGLGITAKHAGELGSVPWLFSHLKLTMHVHLFAVADDDDDESRLDTTSGTNGRSRWSDDVETESMGTGMRKCWFLVQEAGDV